MPRTKAVGRSQAMQSAILAGARHLFLTEGFERTSMDAVAAAVGVSKMTVYRHFRSKEALFSGIINEMCDTIADPELAKAMAKLPLRAALETFGRRSLKTIFDPETLGLHRVVIAESRRFPELGRMFYDRGPAMNVAMLAAYLEREAGNPLLRIADPARAAGEFMVILRGYEHMRVLLGHGGMPTKAALERQVAHAVEHLLRAPADAEK